MKQEVTPERIDVFSVFVPAEPRPPPTAQNIYVSQTSVPPFERLCGHRHPVTAAKRSGWFVFGAFCGCSDFGGRTTLQSVRSQCDLLTQILYSKNGSEKQAHSR